jgi:hypothetical protein
MNTQHTIFFLAGILTCGAAVARIDANLREGESSSQSSGSSNSKLSDFINFTAVCVGSHFLRHGITIYATKHAHRPFKASENKLVGVKWKGKKFERISLWRQKQIGLKVCIINQGGGGGSGKFEGRLFCAPL